MVIRAFRLTEVDLVLDDTLMRRSGKKVALGSMHADPLLKNGGRPFISYGHVFVVLAVHITAPLIAKTGWALPVLFRLFEGSRRGGRADCPSDRQRAASRRYHGKATRERLRLIDRKVVDGRLVECAPEPDSGSPPRELRPTKLQLGTEMVLRIARGFPKLKFRLIADHLYNGARVLRDILEAVDNVSIIVRGRPNAALYELPPPRRPGQRGRPRVRGKRLPNPEQWAEQNADAFRRVVVPMYGKQVEVLVASFLGMAYRSLPGRLLRYVIVKDPGGIYKPDYFISTDIDLPDEEVLAAYSRRWPLERAFQESKQKLGIQDPQTQLPASVRRCAPFGMLLYSLVVFWYVLKGHRLAASLPGFRDPWYPKTARPSFSDMLATMRRLSWAERFIDPPCGDPSKQKSNGENEDSRAARLAAYLARVVAAA